MILAGVRVEQTHVKYKANKIERSFDPNSPMSEKLKESLLKMMEGKE